MITTIEFVNKTRRSSENRKRSERRGHGEVWLQPLSISCLFLFPPKPSLFLFLHFCSLSLYFSRFFLLFSPGGSGYRFRAVRVNFKSLFVRFDVFDTVGGPVSHCSCFLIMGSEFLLCRFFLRIIILHFFLTLHCFLRPQSLSS